MISEIIVILTHAMEGRTWRGVFGALWTRLKSSITTSAHILSKRKSHEATSKEKGKERTEFRG